MNNLKSMAVSVSDNEKAKPGVVVFVMLPVVFLLVALLFSSNANARYEVHTFPNAQAEKDYGILVQELRCLVCQNQNLADSNAELAQDMRLRVYKLLNEGKSREEIVDFMVLRYGDFVMYRPPIKSSTYLLWFGPLVFFAVAGIVVMVFMRRQRTGKSDVKIDEEQQQKAHSLLDDK